MNKIRKDTDRTLIDRSLISAIRSSQVPLPSTSRRPSRWEAFYFWQSSQPLSKNEIFPFVLFSRVECGRPHDSSHSLCAQAYRNMTERGAARTAPPDLQQILSVTAEESFAETIVPSDVNVSSDAAIQQLLKPGRLQMGKNNMPRIVHHLSKRTLKNAKQTARLQQTSPSRS